MDLLQIIFTKNLKNVDGCNNKLKYKNIVIKFLIMGEDMKIKEIYIDNYRNLSGLTIKFDSVMNFIIGNNGVGKSNLMELIDTVFNKKIFLIQN